MAQKRSFIKGQFKLYDGVCKDDRDKLIVMTHWALQKSDCFVSKNGEVRYVDSLVFIFFYFIFSIRRRIN
jgi:hypothetical protein